ncbi:MAG: pyridoxamine 5'-phosphate oxidase family protein [Planctomycetota bacterium]
MKLFPAGKTLPLFDQCSSQKTRLGNMGKVYDHLETPLMEFIRRQKMFFVATAPLASDGRVNVSPKGLDSFRILDERTVAYADLIGSGIETVAHLRENGRIVIMFCAFEGAPKIVRLHGRGDVIDRDHDSFDAMAASFPAYTGLRCFIRIRCERISDSCGFGVPLYEHQGPRSQLTDWAERKGKPELDVYLAKNNAASIDGLPGFSGTDGDPPLADDPQTRKTR